MPLDPENRPRDFMVLVLAIGIRIFGFDPGTSTDGDCFVQAEAFVAEAEKRYGKFSP